MVRTIIITIYMAKTSYEVLYKEIETREIRDIQIKMSTARITQMKRQMTIQEKAILEE